jgi:hypothetical protein
MARPRNRDSVIPQRDGSAAVYPLGPPSALVGWQAASVPTIVRHSLSHDHTPIRGSGNAIVPLKRARSLP